MERAEGVYCVDGEGYWGVLVGMECRALTLGFLGGALMLSNGCAFRGAKSSTPEPIVAGQAGFNEAVDEYAEGIWEGVWWETFGDARLSALIEEGLRSNLDLRGSVARIEQANALVRQSGGRLFPSIELTARDRYEWDDVPSAADDRDRAESTALGAMLDWELDLWGRLRSDRRARKEQEEATIEDWRDARLLLSAAISESYFQAKELKRQLEVVHEQIDINESLLKLTSLRFGQGQSSIVDVLQQQEQLDETKARVPSLEANLGAIEYALDALLGRVPGARQHDFGSLLAEAPDMPEIGVPSTLLSRRPDLRATQRRVAALDYRVAESIADQLPRIRLGGGIDWRGDPKFGEDVRSAFASLTAPLFAGGERKAATRQRKAILEEALADYSQQFIEAVAEVETVLLRERKLEERLILVEGQLENSRRLLTEARNRFSQGLTDYLPVFTALNIVQNLEREIVGARRDILSARVGLHRALGGPIEHPEPPLLVTSSNE